MHREDLIGSLEQGKKADIIVLDRDIHKQADGDVYRLNETEVKRTYLDGKLVWDAASQEVEDIEDELPEDRISVM